MSTRKSTKKLPASLMAATKGRPPTSRKLVTPAPKLRALMVFDELPSAHKLFMVPNDASNPHFRPGEYAVIDTSDREPQHGEFFVIQYDGCERRRYIVQVRAGRGNITGPDAEDSDVWVVCRP